jgi:ketosteroid isomerase-like protein
MNLTLEQFELDMDMLQSAYERVNEDYCFLIRKCDMKYIAESGTEDDLTALYTEANNQVIEKKKNIFQKMIDKIITFIQNIISKVKGKKDKINDDGDYEVADTSAQVSEIKKLNSELKSAINSKDMNKVEAVNEKIKKALAKFGIVAGAVGAIAITYKMLKGKKVKANIDAVQEVAEEVKKTTESIKIERLMGPVETNSASTSNASTNNSAVDKESTTGIRKTGVMKTTSNDGKHVHNASYNSVYTALTNMTKLVNGTLDIAVPSTTARDYKNVGDDLQAHKYKNSKISHDGKIKNTGIINPEKLSKSDDEKALLTATKKKRLQNTMALIQSIDEKRLEMIRYVMELNNDKKQGRTKKSINTATFDRMISNCDSGIEKLDDAFDSNIEYSAAESNAKKTLVSKLNRLKNGLIELKANPNKWNSSDFRESVDEDDNMELEMYI